MKLNLILAAISAGVLVACGGGGGAADGGGGDSAATRSFGTAQIISTAGAEATTGDVALAADGSGYAVWVEEDADGFKVVRARRYVNGAPQEPVTTVSNNPAAVIAGSPQVALSAGGEAVAVWTEVTQGGNGGEAVKGARTLSNGVWQLPVLVQGLSGTTEVEDLDVVGNGQGSALAVWSREVAPDTYAVFGAGFDNGPTSGGFLAAAPISPGVLSAQFPSVAMNASGQALVAWMQPSGGPDSVNRIRVRPYVNNALNDIFEFNGGPFDAGLPKVAVASDGHATVVWEQDDGVGGRAVGFVTSANFTASVNSWRPVNTLPVVGRATAPAVALDAQGVSTVVWIEEGNVKASRFSVSAAPSEVLQTDGGVDNLNLTQKLVASDATGAVVVLWTQDVEPGTTVRTKPFANRFNPVTGRWGQAERIDTGTDAEKVSAHGLSLSVNASGQALALWTRAGATGDPVGIAVNALK